MASDWEAITVLSSIALRAASYVFLRWIPGHHAPPIVFASIVTYLIAFKKTLDKTPPLQIVAEERDTALVDADGKVVAEELDLTLTDEKGRPVAEVDALLEGDALADDDETNEDGDEDGETQAAAAGRSRRAGHEVVEVVESDALILGERPPHILRSLLLGLPSPSSAFWNVVTVLTHLLPALMVADMVYRAPMFYPSSDLSFIKLGFVSESSANLLIREPDAQKLPLTVSIKELGPVNSIQGAAPTDRPFKEIARIPVLSNDTDFTYPVRASSLKPSTVYSYLASTGHNGTFTTAPRPGTFQPGASKFTFLSTSCVKPRFPYNPFAHPLSMPGFRHLAAALPSLNPAFILFLGDWVYVDVPRRLGSDQETYRREHRQVYAGPDWPAVATVPWLHVIDDHEIHNDWDKNVADPFPAAIDAFDIYHSSVNPPQAPAGARDAVIGATWRTFTQGPAAFFLLDTRRYRVDERRPDGPGKTMLGDVQLAALLSWLDRSEPDGVRWKVVVSSVPFTVNWRINAADTWAGYQHERRQVLERMWDIGAGPRGVGVVVLSGDRHEFAATSFPPPRNGKWPVSATVHEFSASPLSMFYLPIRSYWEDNDEQAVAGGAEEDICIKYIPDGNSKFGAVEIDTEVGGDQSRLHYRLFVDGKEAWSHNVMSPPRVRGPRGKDAIWA